VGRDGYVISDWNLTDDGRCRSCHTPCAGVFEGAPGTWGARRLPVHLSNFAGAS
jgi:pyruvate formate lyase activating enzyme